MTIKQIAQALHFSVGTVSMGLADSPKLKAETRREIQAYARRIGYRPNYSAKCLVMGKTLTIGVLLPSLADPFYSEMIEELRRLMDQEDYAGLFFAAGTPEEHQKARENILRRGVDGVISKPMTPEEVSRWQQENIPVVFCDEDEPRADMDVVRLDEEQGGRLVASHFFGLGHTAMGFIGPTGRLAKRYQGYVAELARRGMAVPDKWIVDGLGLLQVGYEGLRKILLQGTPPTAIFCHNDMTAMGALRAAADAGLRIPEDLAVVGFDDIKLARYTIPALTTVKFPIAGVSQRLVEILLEKMSSQGPWKAKKMIFEPRLTIRESSGTAGQRADRVEEEN